MSPNSNSNLSWRFTSRAPEQGVRPRGQECPYLAQASQPAIDLRKETSSCLNCGLSAEGAMEIASLAQEQQQGRFTPAPRTLSDTSVTSNSSAKVQNHSNSESLNNAREKRIKLMCSYGGRILPRPSDRRLRYVGGETRMVSVPRSIHFEAFLRKLTEIYGPDFSVKYQLPEEDLDALVSVTSDEDLENMMDECDRLESVEGASRLRVFVFSSKDVVALDHDIADPTMSELRYVESVNTVQADASFKKSIDSNNSLGHPAYGWNTSQRGPVHQESLDPSSSAPNYYASKIDDISAFVSPPHPVVTARQHTAPLEFISIKAADRGNYYGPGAVGDDFRDLESAGSANSSTSSLYDLYNRIQWASRPQKLPHIETSPNGPQLQDSGARGSLEDQLKKTEQMPIMNVSKRKGAQDVGANVTGINVQQPERLPDELIQLYHTELSDRAHANLNGGTPLSPGARLQKQLEANKDAGKPNGVENTELLLRIEDLQLPKLKEMGKLSVPFNKSSDSDHLISDFFNTQAFEPVNNQPLESSDCARSAIDVRQLDESGKLGFGLEEKSEHGLNMDIPTGFLNADYPSGSYNEDDKERNDLSIFASQSFSKEPYNTVFQTCSSEIPLSSMCEADDLLQQALAPNISFRDQASLNDYHMGITSQAPWKSPDPSSFSISYQGSSPVSEMSSNALGHTQPMGTPRTQNYEAVQGRPPLLSGLYFQGGEQVSNVMNDVLSQADPVEEHPTLDKAPTALPASLSMDRFQAASPVDSNLASSLGSFGEANDKHKDIGFSYAAAGLTELSIDDSLIGLHQGMESSKEPALQQGSPGDAELNFMQGKEEVGSLTLGTISTTSHASPSLLEVWSTTAQSEQETQSAGQIKDIEAIGSGSAIEKELTIDEQKSEIDEIDTFQSVDDRSMNPAVAAEVEAINRGLQIIRHCDLEELRELGSGTFGTVYHGKWRGTDVAIKRIKSSCFTGRPSERERLIADFWREACLLGQLHHPNVVAFYGVVPDGPGGTLATVTEYMVNGSLKQALQKKDRTLDRRKRLLIAMDVAFGMEYLHGRNVVHFDIKCENLLVNLRDLQRPICKVGDLGLSKVKQQTMVSGGVRGTLPWMAPELLNGSSSLVSEKVDVFSFGIVLWELLTGEEPYASMHYGAIIGGIVSNTLRPPVPRWCDSAYRSLMERCWSADPSERPTFSDIARSLRAMEAALTAKAQGQAPPMG
ncbi:hypothetical protein GOP47_0016339 [Adiantum capillus-veneris]|uniref:Protein kinase domain-containing protein n=1 Tax=Adiantum capillus-veneris TaxID=13818 RepID=A0A9D4UIB8_ADICA|nr:hypothetical protein GOP47_0016339 [Adiantum capillus-veneris]